MKKTGIYVLTLKTNDFFFWRKTVVVHYSTLIKYERVL